MFCFLHANHASTNLKTFSTLKLDKFTLFTHSFVGWNLENRYEESVSIFFCLSWHFKREKSVFWKARFCKTRTDYACKTSRTRLCEKQILTVHTCNSWKTLSIIRSHIHVIVWGLHFVGQFLFRGWGRGSAWYWWREYCKRDSRQSLVLLRLQWLTVSELNPHPPPSQKTLFLMVELIIFQLENKLLVKLLVMHDTCS